METVNPPDRSRRPGVAACPITLADANSWGLALPSPRLRPEVVERVDSLGRPTRTIRLLVEFGYPLEIRRLIDDLKSACDRGDPSGQYEALIRLASALICRAHEIDMAEAASLLEMDVDQLPAFVEAVLSVVTGDGRLPLDANRKGGIDG